MGSDPSKDHSVVPPPPLFLDPLVVEHENRWRGLGDGVSQVSKLCLGSHFLDRVKFIGLDHGVGLLPKTEPTFFWMDNTHVPMPTSSDDCVHIQCGEHVVRVPLHNIAVQSTADTCLASPPGYAKVHRVDNDFLLYVLRHKLPKVVVSARQLPHRPENTHEQGPADQTDVVHEARWNGLVSGVSQVSKLWLGSYSPDKVKFIGLDHGVGLLPQTEPKWEWQMDENGVEIECGNGHIVHVPLQDIEVKDTAYTCLVSPPGYTNVHWVDDEFLLYVLRHKLPKHGDC